VSKRSVDSNAKSTPSDAKVRHTDQTRLTFSAEVTSIPKISGEEVTQRAPKLVRSSCRVCHPLPVCTCGSEGRDQGARHNASLVP
jgi:hypothetical protein